MWPLLRLPGPGGGVVLAPRCGVVAVIYAVVAGAGGFSGWLFGELCLPAPLAAAGAADGPAALLPRECRIRFRAEAQEGSSSFIL